jgi:3-deoxy-7-phosphoheptulonate synthase
MLATTAVAVRDSGDDVARRRLQATLVAVAFQGLGIDVLDARRRPRRNGSAGRHRSDGHPARRPRRRHADMLRWAPEHAEFSLLAELGRVRRPILLKRGLSATIKEL